ncbi:MAG: hypothetical protein AB7I04_05050 [Pseudomonadales bacterium]
MTDPTVSGKDPAGNQPETDDHWLVRPATIRRLWIGFAVVLTLTVLAQLLIGIKGYFGVDGWFGFGAGFGFLSCLVMVLAAKGLGGLLKRPEDYYDD